MLNQAQRRSATWVGDTKSNQWFIDSKSMSSPGIEPGSSQPQCEILTTVRTRPADEGHITVHNVSYLRVFYEHYTLREGR
jgi:hypothetical protein